MQQRQKLGMVQKHVIAFVLGICIRMRLKNLVGEVKFKTSVRILIIASMSMKRKEIKFIVVWNNVVEKYDLKDNIAYVCFRGENVTKTHWTQSY